MYEFTPFDSLKYSFANNFKTGNIIIDSLITTFIIGLLTYIYSFRHYLSDYYEQLKNYIMSNKKNQISFTCTETHSMYGYRAGTIKMQGSDAFKAVLLNIKENIRKDTVAGLKKLKEFCADKEEYMFDGDSDGEEEDKKIDDSIKDIIYLVDQRETFKINTDLTKDLDFKMESKIKENKEGKENTNIGKCTTYKLSISSESRSLIYIQTYITLTLKNYLDKLNEKINNSQFVFMYEGTHKEELTYTTYPFDTTCNIDKIYFDNKKQIMAQIDFFKNNKDWYEKHGKPYTLGICSYGLPGCGKTSFEKALAKYLNRHIIIVDLSKITNQQEADRVFFSEIINNKRIPYNKRIYIFPDIDAMNSIISRNPKKEEKPGMDEKRKLLLEKFKKNSDIDDTDFVSLFNITDGPKNKKQQSEPLNLSKLLNIIDGIPERTGQILIFNTNHPKKLDPALIRPGRVDCLIHFQQMNSLNSYQLLENYFDGQKISQSYKKKILEKLEKIGRFWTPAEIFQICAKFNSLDKVIKFLENKEKMGVEI
jgi:SpoVK/Ycf46/Vps4 family AAA+-type ATPase